MKSKYIFILLIFFNCVSTYRSCNRNSSHYQTMHFNPEMTNCSNALFKSLPIIKSAFKNNEFDSLNSFLEMWQHTCVDYSEMNKLQMLINIQLHKPFDGEFDSSFITNLRFHISNYIDNITEYYDKDSRYYYAQNINSFNSWLIEQYSFLATKIDSSDSNFPLLLYLTGDIFNSIQRAINDTIHQQTTFSKIVKREFDNLKGIKLIVPDQYNTIEQAIAVCKDRDTIFLKNGKYKTSTIIEKRIYLIGENKNKTVITNKSKEPCFKLRSGIVLKNLRFEFSRCAVLNLYIPCSEISNCIFYDNLIGISSSSSLPLISNCIFNNNRTAITLINVRAGRSSITNNIFDNNRTAINCVDMNGLKIQFNIFGASGIFMGTHYILWFIAILTVYSLISV